MGRSGAHPLSWGAGGAIGVIVGDRIVVNAGTKRGLDARDVKFLNARIVIGGFVVAH